MGNLKDYVLERTRLSDGRVKNVVGSLVGVTLLLGTIFGRVIYTSFWIKKKKNTAPRLFKIRDKFLKFFIVFTVIQ